MKKTAAIFLLTLCIATGSTSSFAKDISDGAASRNMQHSVHQAERLAVEISNVVGISISPLLALAALGAWHWLQTPQEQRGILPWHKQPQFWMPLLALLGLILLKDGTKTAAPIPKQLFIPVDAAETVLNKGGGLLGLFVVLSGAASGQYPEMTALLQNGTTILASTFFPASAHAALAGGGEIVHTLQSVVTEVVLSFCFTVVWLVGHTVNVLILLSPFALIDMVLKIARNTLLASLTFATTLHPWLGLLYSILIVLAAWIICSWAFRFMCFGTVFTLDLLRRRHRSFFDSESGKGLTAFSGIGCPDIPRLSYGQLYSTDGRRIEFRWRPWLIFPLQTFQLPEESDQYAIGIQHCNPVCVHCEGETKKDFFHLPPRYRNHEKEVAETLSIREVCDIRLGRGIDGLFEWIRTRKAAHTTSG